MSLTVFRCLLGIVLCLSLMSCQTAVAPVSSTVFSAETTAGTTVASSLPIRMRLLPDTLSRPREQTVTHVMIHFMSNVVNHPQNPYDMEEIEATFVDYEVSSHYVIARDGTIVRFVPEDRVAYHAGKGALAGFPAYDNRLNDFSIGIELLAIGTQQEMADYLSSAQYAALSPAWIGYTEAQYAALDALLEEIIQRHPAVKRDRAHLVGHDDYTSRKQDPGSLFRWENIVK